MVIIVFLLFQTANVGSGDDDDEDGGGGGGNRRRAQGNNKTKHPAPSTNRTKGKRKCGICGQEGKLKTLFYNLFYF